MPRLRVLLIVLLLFFYYLSYNRRDMNALVVGSSTIDLFLQPSNTEHTPIVDDTITLHLGDKIPINVQSMTLGGNGANVAVSLTRLGIPTEFYTYLGSDVLSYQIQNIIEKEGVKLVVEKGESASFFSLIFQFDHDRIIFSHHPTQNHGFTYTPSDMPELIYLTSIGKKWEEAYQKVLSFSQQNPTILAFSPGSQQLATLGDTFYAVLEKSSLIFVNKEEAQRILATEETDPKKLLAELSKKGPKTVSITDGKNGAYAQDKDGNQFAIESLPLTPPFEKTGAGDAYASGFLAAFMQQYHLEDCMRWGILNSHASMHKIGAQTGLLKTEQMKAEINNARLEVSLLS